jgi:hypothetical protein
MRWSIQHQDIPNRGAFGAQVINGGDPLWKVSLEFDMHDEAKSGDYKAFLLKLAGMRNNLELWDIGRPEVRGTLSGAQTLASSAALGASSVSITGTAGNTLLPGDYFGLGTGYAQQVLMVTDAVTWAGASATVNFHPPLRSAWSAGQSVTLSTPKALFRSQAQEVGWNYSKTTVDGMSLDLLEDWRA